ncbi:hypothetical protein Lal_00001453 [Lupinus albus]|uniref:Uncharacterized protein n=1 Tax=Lupinus albus TaxID=3870 RepID=A0A6A4P6K9_LUPAL|nr:hypothetical protein Lalb_Chr18g0052521 [Lupinus albus]KAF1891309.1 hypothetical protein Lal_00001453 [Lupinus albus]
MGCSQSRLDDEEAVQLCKDRKRFIKQAVEQRTHFATGHIAYIQSLKRVSAALRDYIESNEPHEFSIEPVIIPPLTPVKKTSPAFIPISSSKSFCPTTLEFGVRPNSSLKVNYLRPGGNPPISVEERPQSHETVRVETYPPMQHRFGYDGFYAMQSTPMMNPSFFAMDYPTMNPSIFSYSPNNRPNIPPPPSPQTSQWDSFWNPFSSLEYYGYPTRSSLDEYQGMRRVREEEGIPELEEDETEQEDYVRRRNVADERIRTDINSSKEKAKVEEVDEDEDDDDDDDDGDDDDDDDDDDEEDGDEEEGTDCETDTEIEHVAKDSQAHGSANSEVLKAQRTGHVEPSHQEMATGNQEAKEETPGFTVIVNRRPTSMAEVINDLEAQFTILCNAANDVSVLLESNKAQYLLTSNELSASKYLNPVALFRSASSRSSSSRFLMNCSSTRYEGHEGTKDLSEEHCISSSSHQSTLDKLNVWEKKLYEEVKSGERVRIAYEKKCKQLGDQDVKFEDPSYADKTRATIRDLNTQIKVSIHSVEAISKRIETLRDEELHPQLLELVQGLARMWEVMAECHQTQKRTLDEAKILLAGTAKLHARKQSSMSTANPYRLARSASNLEVELRNWRNTFESWITSQRSYVHALTGWLLRCVRSSEPNTSNLACSPSRANDTHPLFGLCVQWSRNLDSIHEKAVFDGLEFLAAGMGSLYAQHLREDSQRNSFEPKQVSGSLEMVQVGHVEEMSPEKLAEVGIKVLCAGMSVAISSLAEYAFDSAKGYSEVLKHCENVKSQHTSTETKT